MHLNNIKVSIRMTTGNKYYFEAIAASTGNRISFGVVSTFTFNVLTGVFSAGGERLTGVKECVFEEPGELGE